MFAVYATIIFLYVAGIGIHHYLKD